MEWTLLFRNSLVTELAWFDRFFYHSDVIIRVMMSQITCIWIFCSTNCSAADQTIHQSSASLVFVRGIHRWPVDSPHKRPVTRKMFPFDDAIMYFCGPYIKLRPDHARKLRALKQPRHYVDHVGILELYIRAYFTNIVFLTLGYDMGISVLKIMKNCTGLLIFTGPDRCLQDPKATFAKYRLTQLISNPPWYSEIRRPGDWFWCWSRLLVSCRLWYREIWGHLPGQCGYLAHLNALEIIRVAKFSRPPVGLANRCWISYPVGYCNSVLRKLVWKLKSSIAQYMF